MYHNEKVKNIIPLDIQNTQFFSSLELPGWWTKSYFGVLQCQFPQLLVGVGYLCGEMPVHVPTQIGYFLCTAKVQIPVNSPGNKPSPNTW